MTDKNISVQLSMRLRAIAGMVTKGNRLADVGCDHGYLSIWLVSEKTVPSAIAMDVRPGPLSRARENISRYGLEDYIETRLSDGLTKLEPGEGDTLVIAGMGGPLMERIRRKVLSNDESGAKRIRRTVCLYRGRSLVWATSSEKVPSGSEGISSQGGIHP